MFLAVCYGMRVHPRSIPCFVLCATMFACGSEDTGTTHEGSAQDTGSALRVCPAPSANVRGIDVSTYEGDVQWSAVKQAGYAFSFARVSDGLGTRDETFARNWRGMKSVGIVRGAYQYFVTEAVGTLGDGDLPVVLDLESSSGQSSSTVKARALSWLQRVETATGKLPIVYTFIGFWETLGETSAFKKYPLWVANYKVSCPSIPDTWGSAYRFWQYSESGSVPGISGDVDMNLWNGSKEELVAFASGGAPPKGTSSAAVAWARTAPNTYTFSARPGEGAVRVEYYVDDFPIGGRARAESPDFAISYAFSQRSNERTVTVKGFDAAGVALSQGNALLDVTDDTALHIWPVEASVYEIGLERAPSQVAAIEVRADGYLLTDTATGTSRSKRLAVSTRFLNLGPRTFAVSTFDASGNLRGTLHRTFTLR
jgi:GH25 family lysozyme M1 (1,4-beta-N-acetylmuramidase)